jgi:hypothetical protein
MYDAVVFAGGRNRCYWQGGFYETIAARLGVRPKLVVGASAGTFAANYSLLGAGPAVRDSVYTGGGLVDNVPVAPLEPIEAAGGKTLVSAFTGTCLTWRGAPIRSLRAGSNSASSTLPIPTASALPMNWA